MLVDLVNWEKIVSNMGINNSDKIIIYDNSDVVSSCRCWFNFIYFGHDPKLVHVLNGGFQKWLTEKRVTTDKLINIQKSEYRGYEKKNLVKNKELINENISQKNLKLLTQGVKKDLKERSQNPEKV